MAGLSVLLTGQTLLGQELAFSHFSTDHPELPLPSASVQALLQDSEGFVWLGFYSAGVARYDGHTLTIYGMEDGLPDLTVREIVEDARGHLWVGSDSGLVVSQKPLSDLAIGSRVSFVSEMGGVEIAQTRIHRNWLAADRRDGIWVGTAGKGVVHYRIGAPNKLEVETLDLEAAGMDGREPAGALAVRADGTLWCALASGAVAVLHPSDDIPVSLDRAALPSSPVRCFHEGPSRTLWAGCEDGSVWRWQDGAARFVQASVLLEEQVMSMLETPEGDLWVGSIGSGLARLSLLQSTPGTLIGLRNGLPSETDWDLMQDHEGNLWFAHNAGVSRLRPNYRAFTHLTARAQAGDKPVLPERTVFAVLPPGAPQTGSLMWAGTGGGLAAVDPDWQSSVITPEHGLSSAAVYALGRDSAGRVWIGTLRGLNVLDFSGRPPHGLGDAATHIVRVFSRSATLVSIGLSTTYDCVILSLAADNHSLSTTESVWISGKVGVACWVEEEWFLFGARSGLPGSGATATTIDGRGRLWVSTKDSGVLRSREPLSVERMRRLVETGIADREITAPVFESVWTVETGAPTNVVNSIQHIAPYTWAATPAGLLALDGDPLRVAFQLDAAAGLGGSHVRGLCRNPSTGRLWVTQNRGVAEIDPVSGSVLRVVSKGDGMIDDEVWTADGLALGESGELYLGTPKGITIYRAELDLKNRVPPRPRLTHVELRTDDRGRSEATFRYAALSYANEPRVRFRTRLVGYDSEWSPATGEHQIRYTNLPAFLFTKTYTFEVMAANDAGLWNDGPVRHSFRVQPPPWSAWWAVGIYAAVLGGAVVGVYLLRTRSLVRQARVLERRVNERTEALQREKEHAETISHELESLDEIVENINRELSLEWVMEALLEQGRVLLSGVSRGAFLLRDQAGGLFHVAAVSGWDASQLADFSLTADEAEQRYSRKGRRLDRGIYLIRDLEHRAGAEKVRHLPSSSALLSLNLAVEGELVGFLIFDLYDEPSGSHLADVRKLRRYREHAISALQRARTVRQLESSNTDLQTTNRQLVDTSRQLEIANAKLQRLSSNDGLTGVANRRFFDEVIDLEWKRAHRTSSELAAIMIDIDCFKDFNDAYGHQAGDDCLRSVASAIQTSLSRPTDFFARYGGEEFVVLLPATDGPGALTVAEALRAEVEDLSITHEHSRAAAVVTVSVGVAVASPAEGGSPAGLIAEADRALYAAKEGGRNRVRFEGSGRAPAVGHLGYGAGEPG
ncbi:MAG: diguanylate cyclase [bacterium]|nr:diguanylate cyclase [bacterium]